MNASLASTLNKKTLLALSLFFAISSVLYTFLPSALLSMLWARTPAVRSITVARNMSSLSHAKIVSRTSSTRGHADHGWLNTYHSFSFASWQDPKYESFGSLRVLNEDRVAPENGFPTHPHRDFEIFSYIISGELTHRDSIKGKGAKAASKNDYYVMKRGDVQFTTGGTGIAHSEQNENSSKWVHFLQIWVKPWARSLPPTYHTSTFSEESKRNGFVTIISPLTGGKHANAEEEKAARPLVADTIPIHADFLMGASIVPVGKKYSWIIGGGVVSKKTNRNVYVHLTTAKGGKSSLQLDGRKDAVLKEGDAAFITGVNDGDELVFESIGSDEAEVVVLDSD